MQHTSRIYLTEYLASFFFILAIFASGGSPLIIGAALAIAIFFAGSISGGHLNPAVSVGMLMDGKLASHHFLGYVVAQILGAASAYYAYKMTK
jgi:aquaporin Z